MNIIKQRQAQRLEKIKNIREYLLIHKDADLIKLRMEVCSSWGITRKYFEELLEIAQFEIGEKNGCI